ncbi:MAG TPA: hypothetical protein VFK30_12760, partial [Anaerolineae bacterium]|nr:hypothetical protein [Anaerolineae bacterium]
MDLPRILPLDNEERIRTLICDGLITRGITDQCLGLAKHQRRHTQVSAKIAASTTFSTAAADSEPRRHPSNSESPYQQLWR